MIRKVVELLLRIKELKRERRAGDWQAEGAEGALIGVRRWRGGGGAAISIELGGFFCGACDCQVGHFCTLIRSLFPPLEADFFVASSSSMLGAISRPLTVTPSRLISIPSPAPKETLTEGHLVAVMLIRIWSIFFLIFINAILKTFIRSPLMNTKKN